MAAAGAPSARAEAQNSGPGKYAPTRSALAELGLQARGATYRGFAREAAMPVEEERELLPVWPTDIVGNQEVLDAGLDLARAVAGFDLARGENPRKLRNPVLFMLGAPGCGKTVTAHAIGNFFLDLCQRHKIPARFRIIRRTDWASHYQNRSANELLRIFKATTARFRDPFIWPKGSTWVVTCDGDRWTKARYIPPPELPDRW